MTERSVTQQQFHDQLIGRTFKCVDDARRAVGISAGTPFRFMIVLKNMGFAATYPEIGVCKIVESPPCGFVAVIPDDSKST